MSLLSNNLILYALDEYVVGHKEAKKALITMLSRSRLRQHQKYNKGMDGDCLLAPLKILLIGASGSGKTHLLESLRKIVHFPLVRIDATQLIPSGGSGGIKPNDLRKLIVEEAVNCSTEYPYLYQSVDEAVDRCVIFVDEIDKLGTSWESSGNWNKHVQSNFLTMIDNKNEFSGISFVFAGAFKDITVAKEKRKNLGFTFDSCIEEQEFIDDRVIKSGLIPEIVGRINLIVELDVFTEDNFRDILTQRIIPKKRMDLAAYRIWDINITEDQINELAKEACKSGQGVRYLNRAIDKMFLDLEFDASVENICYLD